MKNLNQSELENIKSLKTADIVKNADERLDEYNERKDKKVEIYNKCMIEEEIENLKNEGKGDN